MRYHEVQDRPAAPDSHPFTADIVITPSAFAAFERAMDDRHDVQLLCRIDHPGAWCVHVACASATVRQRLLGAMAESG